MDGIDLRGVNGLLTRESQFSPSLAFFLYVLFFQRQTSLVNWVGVLITLVAIYLGMARKSAKIVKEDIGFLSTQLDIMRQRKDKRHEVSVKGDEISLAFRKFWRKKMKQASG